MKLYHNGLSTCSQKVRLVLAEKNLAFDSVEMNLQRGDQFAPDYLKINAKAVVPTLEDHDGIYVESTLINDYLDDAYPDIALRPHTAAERYLMNTLIKVIDDTEHPACSVITYAVGLLPMMRKNNTPEQLTKLIDSVPDPVRRENRRAVMQQGIKAPVFREAYTTYVNVLKNADAQLRRTRWLAGDTFSLADCAYLPYVLRLHHLGQKAFIDSLPGLSGWYTAMQERPSYQVAVTKWLPQPIVENLLREGAAVANELSALN
ncbi:MAG: glutathione S-transferase family protein [Pseudomonadota bacterium]